MRALAKGNENRARWSVGLTTVLLIGVSLIAAGFVVAKPPVVDSPAIVLPKDAIMHDRIMFQTSVGGDNTGWIEVMSWSWGVSQTGDLSGGGGSGSGKASFQDFHFTKRLDKNSPFLAKTCTEGRHLPKVTFEDYSTDAKGKNQTYLIITFEDVLVSSYQVSGQGGGDAVPMEEVSLNYAKIEFKYVGPGSTDATTFRWDLKENKGG
jgi:type VI secretion system secreted protein Hcp